MPKISKSKPTSEKKPQEETPTTSSSSTTETPSKLSPAAQLAKLVHKYGKAETKMLGEILKVLGMNPDLEEAETETNEMRSTLELVLAAIEDLQAQERERFKTLESMFQEHLDISRASAAAMQTVADALKASQ